MRRFRRTERGKAASKAFRKRHAAKIIERKLTPESKLQHWRWSLKYRYNFSEAEYNAMLEAQHGVCAICYRPPKNKRLHVDHDHVTGKVRGLLCDTCNRVLGMMNDDAKRFVRAADYLLKTQGAPSPN